MTEIKEKTAGIMLRRQQLLENPRMEINYERKRPGFIHVKRNICRK